MSRRLEWIDIAKGIGILLVIIGHAFQGIIVSQNLSPGHYLWYLKQIIYSFHMPLFFILSGWFLNRFLKLSFIEATKNKLPLMRHYFIWTLITGGFMELASSLTNNGQGLVDIVKSPFIPFSEYWYLYVLFFASLLIWLLKNKLFVSTKFLTIFSVFFYLIYPIIGDVWILDDLGKYLIFLVVGLNGKEYLNFLYSFRKNVGIFMLYAMALLIFLFFLKNGSVYSNYAYYFTALTGSVLVLQISMYIDSKFEAISGILQYFGKNSLFLYVAHLLPLAGSRIIILKMYNTKFLLLPSILISVISLFSCVLAIEVISYFRTKLSNN